MRIKVTIVSTPNSQGHILRLWGNVVGDLCFAVLMDPGPKVLEQKAAEWKFSQSGSAK